MQTLDITPIDPQSKRPMLDDEGDLIILRHISEFNKERKTIGMRIRRLRAKGKNIHIFNLPGGIWLPINEKGKSKDIPDV